MTDTQASSATEAHANSTPKSPYEILGEDGICRLAEAFYEVMDELPQAEKIRNMHSKHLGEIKKKLADYLVGWMGGPPRYHDKHGTVCLTDPHAAYAIGPQERDQWLLCFDGALERINATDELKEMLKTPIARLAQAVQNRETSLPENNDPNIIAIG